ncbi:choline transport protein [Annulohypoxylon moriforme]|nr:choline transport protein [Annulohypoxylon moriforme]
MSKGPNYNALRGVFEPVISGPVSRDDAALARLGKKPVLRRHFGFLTILGFSCTVLVTWEGSLMHVIPITTDVFSGGPTGIIVGYLIVWAGTFSIFIILSELVSMAPTSGGQYHWVSMLSPPWCRRFLSYFTGWLTITGWQAFVASAAFLTGSLIQGLVLLTHPNYVNTMQNWHGTLLFWAVILLAYGINSVIGSVLAKFEGVVLIIHILGFFIVILPLTLLGTKNEHEAVWNTWVNLGGWQTQGLSFCIGIIGNVFAFVGADGAIHMSEEIRDAPLVVPRSLLTGLAVNGSLGFAMVVVTLYYVGDINEALAENPLFPFMAIFKQALPAKVSGAATAMSVVPLIMSFSATTGILASASRIYWAFARDRGLPGWRTIRKVNSKTSVPLYAVMVTVVISMCLSLINIGGSAAFNGAISISIAGLFGSYLITASLLLYRRLRGDIRSPQASRDSQFANTTNSILVWGPWRIKGLLGIANNLVACLFLAFTFFFSFWPAFRDVTPQNMNWSILVSGTVILFSVSYYGLQARKVYTGPIVETL